MSAGPELLRFSDRRIVIFDFETSHLGLMDGNLPFECAWCVADRHRIIEEHQYYLKWPNYRISKGAAAITAFKQSWVDTGTDPEQVLRAFESYALDESMLLGGHNILGFDWWVWRQWRHTLGYTDDTPILAAVSRCIDTNLLSRAYKMGWKPDRTNLKAWQFKVQDAWDVGVKTSLGVMAKELGVPIEEAKMHSALVDLRVNYGVYRKLINLTEI